jgi:hypothetical protein
VAGDFGIRGTTQDFSFFIFHFSFSIAIALESIHPNQSEMKNEK